MEFTTNQLILANIIILFSFYTRALTGFGSALISIPLLSLIFPLQFIVPLGAIFEVFFSFASIKSVYKNINFRVLYPMFIGSLIGSLIGTYFLKSFATPLLAKVLGGLIVIFAIDLLVQKNLIKLVGKIYGILAGTIGGILGGMFGTSGPAFVFYLENQIGNKDILRATIIGLFTFDFTIRLAMFSYGGLITKDIILMSIYLLPALILGMILGRRQFKIVHEETYKKFIIILLVISGVTLLLK